MHSRAASQLGFARLMASKSVSGLVLPIGKWFASYHRSVLYCWTLSPGVATCSNHISGWAPGCIWWESVSETHPRYWA